MIDTIHRKLLKRPGVFLILLLLLLLFSSACPVSAAKTKKPKWVKKQGYWYYYDSKGKKFTGIRKINGKSYYFDSQGRQRSGWRIVNGSYYFFIKSVKGKAYMVKNATVNFVRLGKNGKAVLSNDIQARRAEMLAGYQYWADQIVKPDYTKSQRRNACIRAIAQFAYEAEDAPAYSGTWDLTLAEQVYYRYLYGPRTLECERYAVGFSYLCNAAGLKSVSICIGTDLHGWTLLEGVAYDPTRYVTRGNGFFPITTANLNSFGYYAVHTIRLC